MYNCTCCVCTQVRAYSGVARDYWWWRRVSLMLSTHAWLSSVDCWMMRHVCHTLSSEETIIFVMREWKKVQSSWLRCSSAHSHPEAFISPRGNDAFPSLFQIPPYFRKSFRRYGKFFRFDLFPKIFPIFICLFLVIDSKFRMSPLFQQNWYISPYFWGKFFTKWTFMTFRSNLCHLI